MSVARNSFCRKYFGKDREYLTAEEMKEYWRIAKKISRANNPKSYAKEIEYNKNYFKTHEKHLRELQRQHRIINKDKLKQYRLERFIKKHGHKPYENSLFFRMFGVQKKDGSPEMIRRYNAERVKEWKKRKKLAQTF